MLASFRTSAFAASKMQMRGLALRARGKVKHVEVVKVIRNEAITFERLRVIFTQEIKKSDMETQENKGQSSSSSDSASYSSSSDKQQSSTPTRTPATKEMNVLMDRQEALDLAKSLNLDLILVEPNANPPVCRIRDYGKMTMDKKKKDKKAKISAKTRGLKETMIGAGIDTHDLQTKMKQTKGFLALGHPVQIHIQAKKKDFKRSSQCVVDTTMKILDALEGHVGQIMERQSKGGNNNQQIFTVTPLQSSLQSSSSSPP